MSVLVNVSMPKTCVRRSFPSLFVLNISDSPIDRVYFFKYLGVFLTPSLSFSMHISHICKKSRKVLGLIFRHFYRFSSSSSIIRLLCLGGRSHEAYSSSFVCVSLCRGRSHEAYCNRAVCQSVSQSVIMPRAEPRGIL